MESLRQYPRRDSIPPILAALVAAIGSVACSGPGLVEVVEVERTGPGVEVGAVDVSAYPEMVVDLRVLGPDGQPVDGVAPSRMRIEPLAEGPLARPGRIASAAPMADSAAGNRPVLDLVLVLGGDVDRAIGGIEATTLREAVVRFLNQRLDSSTRVGIVLVDADRTIGPGLDPADAAEELSAAALSGGRSRSSLPSLRTAATSPATAPRTVVAIPGPSEPSLGSDMSIDTAGRSVWVLLPRSGNDELWRRIGEATGGSCLDVEPGESGVLALGRLVEKARRRELSGRYRVAYRSGVVDPAATEQGYAVEVDLDGSREARGETKVRIERGALEAALDSELPELFREAKALAQKKGIEPAVGLLAAVRERRPDSEPVQAALASVLAEVASGWLALGEDAIAIELLAGKYADAARADRVVAERLAEVYFEAARDRRRGNEPAKALALTNAVRRHLPGISSATEQELALRARLRQLIEAEGVEGLVAELGEHAPAPGAQVAAREVVLERSRALVVEGGVLELIRLERQLAAVEAEWGRAARTEVHAMVVGAVDAAIGRGDVAQAERWIAEAEAAGDPAEWRSRRLALERRGAEIALGGPRQDRAEAIERLGRALGHASGTGAAEIGAELARIAAEEAEHRASRGEAGAARSLLDSVRRRTGAAGRAALDRAAARVSFHSARVAREAGDWQAARASFLESMGAGDALSQTEAREAEVGAIEACARLSDWEALATFAGERGLDPGATYLAGSRKPLAQAFRARGEVLAGRNRSSEAVAAFQESLRWEADPAARQRLVDCQLAAGDPDSAARSYLDSGTDDVGGGSAERPERVARALLASGRPEPVFQLVARSGGSMGSALGVELLVSAHILSLTRDAAALAGPAIDQVPAILGAIEEVVRVDVVGADGRILASSAGESGRAWSGPMPDLGESGRTAVAEGGNGLVVVGAGSSRIVVRHRLLPTSSIAAAIRATSRSGDWPGVVAAMENEVRGSWARSAAILAAEGLARDLADGGDGSSRLAAIRSVVDGRGGTDYVSIVSGSLAEGFAAGPVEAPADPRADGAGSTYRTERKWEKGMVAVEYAHPVYVGSTSGKSRWGVVRWGVLDGRMERTERGKQP